MRLIEDANASKSGTGNATVTYTSTNIPQALSFANDSSDTITLTVGIHTIEVRAGETLDQSFEVPFTSVAVAATGSWRLMVGD